MPDFFFVIQTIKTMPKRHFELLGTAHGSNAPVFTGTFPRAAALKAASRGFTDIHLRERGNAEGKVHHFVGTIEVLDEPNIVEVNGTEITHSTKAHVMKSGTYKLHENKSKSSIRSPKKSPRKHSPRKSPKKHSPRKSPKKTPKHRRSPKKSPRHRSSPKKH